MSVRGLRKQTGLINQENVYSSIWQKIITTIVQCIRIGRREFLIRTLSTRGRSDDNRNTL